MAHSNKLQKLIETEQLPTSYLDNVPHWIRPISHAIAHKYTRSAPKKCNPAFIGVQGVQGCGKSTCSLFFKAILEEEFGLTVTILSIDDFYLTYDERQTLAQKVHPLLATRGVPGTHDVALLEKTLKQLYAGDVTPIPRFDKATDDRKSKAQWDTTTDNCDIIILEGWFIGLAPASESTLDSPINELESIEDPHGVWRKYVNSALMDYQRVFNRLDELIILQAPSFECVFNWRLRQEQKLIESLKNQPTETIRTLDERGVKHFISHFERLTRHALNTLPNKANWCMFFTKDQKIDHVSGENLSPSHVVFTDLDGTLLDHHNYSWNAAHPAIEQLEDKNIPIIFNTSKTAEEALQLQDEINIHAPVIIENGSAIIFHKSVYIKDQIKTLNCEVFDNQHLCIVTGEKREKIVYIAQTIRDKYQFKFESYSDWQVEDIMTITGLNKEKATLSSNRKFSEPLIWHDSDEKLTAFKQTLEEHNLTLLKGGRFYHIIGQTDKVRPMTTLMEHIYPNSISIALGDGQNDAKMIAGADIGICIKSPVNAFPKIEGDKTHITYTTEEGPTGWNNTLIKILKKV